MSSPRLPGIVATLTVCLWLAACSQPPFDARSAWIPTQADESASFGGGIMSSRPSMGFDLFERDPTERVADVSVPRALGENPWATPARNVVVTVCYGRLVNDREAVRLSALEICPANSRLEYLGTDTFWNACPLLQPARASFRCEPATAGEEPAEPDEAGGDDAVRRPNADESLG